MSSQFKIINSAIALVLIALASTHGRAAEVTSAISLCEANPACSHTVPNRAGTVVFKVRNATESKTIVCDMNGKCSLVLPRGQVLSIKDFPATLVLK